MAKIVRMKDRFEVKVGKGKTQITFIVGPMSNQDKGKVQDYFIRGAGNPNANIPPSIEYVNEGTKLAIKACLKEVHGITTEDDEGNEIPYELEFDESGQITDECIDELLNAGFNNELTSVAANFTNGVPDKVTGPDGKPIPGITIKKKRK